MNIMLVLHELSPVDIPITEFTRDMVPIPPASGRGEGPRHSCLVV